MRPFLCQKIRRIVIMDLTEKLNLVGYFEGESKQLKSVEEVADFICKNGKHGDGTVIKNGGYTNGTVSVEWTDEVTVTATKDGETFEYNSGIELKDDGEYVIVFENFDGEKLVYKFVIDTIAPELTVSGMTRGSKGKDDVSVGFAENDMIVQLYKNGELAGDYVSETLITESGKYKVVATDKAGNVSEVEFEIDKIAPMLVITGVENGGHTSGRVTLSELSEESTVTVKLNARNY